LQAVALIAKSFPVEIYGNLKQRIIENHGGCRRQHWSKEELHNFTLGEIQKQNQKANFDNRRNLDWTGWKPDGEKQGENSMENFPSFDFSGDSSRFPHRPNKPSPKWWQTKMKTWFLQASLSAIRSFPVIKVNTAATTTKINLTLKLLIPLFDTTRLSYRKIPHKNVLT
jgi:hypothetical protein